MKTYLKQTVEYSGYANYMAYDQNKLTSISIYSDNKTVDLYKHDDLAEFICCLNNDLNENNAEVITRKEFNEAANTFSTMYNDFIKEL